MSAVATTAFCNDSECGWSWTGSQREAEDRARAHAEMFDHTWRLGDVSDVAATAALNGSGYACKVDGCSEPASANRGPNAYRCEKHKHARKPKAEPRKQPPASGSGSLDTLAAKVQSARGDLTAALAAFDEAVAAVREAAA